MKFISLWSDGDNMRKSLLIIGFILAMLTLADLVIEEYFKYENTQVSYDVRV